MSSFAAITSVRGTAAHQPPSSKRYKMSSIKESTSLVNIGFIGGGNLARCITEGLIKTDEKYKKCIYASFATTGDKYKKMKALGVHVSTDNKDIVLNSDVIVLSVKPHQILGILDELQKIYKELSDNRSLSGNRPSHKNLRPLIVSVATSITIKQIEEKTEISWKMGGTDMIGHLPVIRCLPTVATSVNSGVTVYSTGCYCNEQDAKMFLNIFNSCGFCQEVPEPYIDGFTSFTGSGVAFEYNGLYYSTVMEPLYKGDTIGTSQSVLYTEMAVIMEALADGGVLVGIPRDLADKMAAYTMMSAAKMVLEGQVLPSEIKSSTASPGGCTIRGLQVIEESGARGAIMGAVRKATERAVEIRQQNS